MERTAARHAGAEQTMRGEADDLAGGEQGLERIERAGRRWRSVTGHNHDAIGDDEIHVGGGQGFALGVSDKAGTGDPHDVELAALGIGRAQEDLRDALEELRIGIIGAGRRLADDAAGGDEARHIVDMAVSVVVSETLSEPNDLARAEGVVKRSFGLLLAPIVAVGVEQSLAAGKDRAGPVLVDGASFEHEIEFPDPDARKLGDVVADDLIVGEVELAAPAIELEAEREFVAVAPREDRPGIAQPYVAVTRVHQLRNVAQLLARGGFNRGAVHQQPDRKSTRLNSSHMSNSYAVLCLKKKTDTELLPVLQVDDHDEHDDPLLRSPDCRDIDTSLEHYTYA